jgi:endogenous inhibitor of DNA gyrase (YacG/DUF329 family)
MASWTLKCPNCDSNFVHSSIEDTFENYFWPKRPTVPDDGIKMDCPECGKSATYQTDDLRYQSGDPQD